jgi:release factor glutamine methyltransferase
MSLKNILQRGKEKLAAANISAVDGELLLAHVLGIERMELHARNIDLSDGDLIECENRFEELLTERIAGLPTQYLTGQGPFRYLTFDVGPGVLIPRPESEGLVDLALNEINNSQKKLSVVDLGAGSGALSISLWSEARNSGKEVSIIAVENSPEAIAWLERNIARHEADVRVVKSDVATALTGVKCDLVIANPPYIPRATHLPSELSHEPEHALFGGELGYEKVQEFIDAAARILKSEGSLYLEHFEDQAQILTEYLAQNFKNVRSYDDLNGRNRYISATRR